VPRHVRLFSDLYARSLYSGPAGESYESRHALSEEIRGGHFEGLLGWLRENVHQLGHRFSAEETVRRATGKGLDTAAFSATSNADPS